MKNDCPLLTVYNSNSDSRVSWCTPSISLRVPRVRGIYENDISVSYHKLGNLALNSGIFKKAHKLASRAYKSDYSLFVVNGSTGSNFIILRALKKQFGSSLKILAQRNVHKSFCVACEDYKIAVSYLKPEYDNHLQIFLPNKVTDILEEIKKQQPDVLFITNPTYEGFSLDLKELIKKARNIKSNIIIYVDEAWGGHFVFSSKLPESAMEAGADICVQSTHKQASSLQQTSMIHCKNGAIDNKLLLESFKDLTTTSPSYHLLASLDASRYFMENNGSEEIDRLISLAEYFQKELNLIPGVKVWTPKEIITKFKDNVNKIDRTKLIIHLDGISGIGLSHILEKKYNVVVEKYDARNIFLIMTLRNHKPEVIKTVTAIKEILENKNKKIKIADFPSFPKVIKTIVPSYEIWNMKHAFVHLKDAVGKVVAEDIVPYPPGIPLLIKGEEFKQEHLEYLNALRSLKNKVTVLMKDQKLSRIRVLKEEGGKDEN